MGELAIGPLQGLLGLLALRNVTDDTAVKASLCRGPGRQGELQRKLAPVFAPAMQFDHVSDQAWCVHGRQALQSVLMRRVVPLWHQDGQRLTEHLGGTIAK